MTPEKFQRSLIENFPTQLPDSSRLFEGVRVESGHECLECLQSIEWPEFSFDIIEFVAGEFWQLSNVWTRYYIPAVMSMTANTELEFNEFGELPDNQENLMTILFSYWCSADDFQTERFDITKNVFYGLTSEQIDIVEKWLNVIDFKTLQTTHNLPESFDYTASNISNLIEKMRKIKA